MASPQIENGYTRIANEILDHLCFAGINGSEYRVLIFVIRKTYGFQKKSDRISLSQFQKGTLISRRHVVTTINSLVHKRTLLKENGVYRLNKNWEEWIVHKRTPSAQKGTTASAQMGTKGSAQMGTHKRKKETITKENTPASQDLTENKNTKPMKKNSFGKYREDLSSDTFETVIDADTGEEEKYKPKGSNSKIMSELLEWATKRRGGVFVNTGKQYKALANLKQAKIPPEAIKNRWIELESEEYHKLHGLDFMSVASSFDKKPL